MALIKCPECGKEISDKARRCPKCGYSLSNEFNKKKKSFSFKVLVICIGIFIAIAIFYLISQIMGGNDESINNETTNNETTNNESTLDVTANSILKMQENIGDVDDGNSEEMELCGENGVVTYTNTLPGLIDYTNTATWIPDTRLETEYVYECMVDLYGEPIDTGGAYWSWQNETTEYRIVLQHGDLGIRIITQKEIDY